MTGQEAGEMTSTKKQWAKLLAEEVRWMRAMSPSIREASRVEALLLLGFRVGYLDQPAYVRAYHAISLEAAQR